MKLFRKRTRESAQPVLEEESVVNNTLQTKEPTEEITHDRKQQYHVSHHKDGWKVKLTHGAKAIKVFRTQAEAIDYAKELSKKHDMTYQIHKRDGSIRKKKY